MSFCLINLMLCYGVVVIVAAGGPSSFISSGRDGMVNMFSYEGECTGSQTGHRGWSACLSVSVCLPACLLFVSIYVCIFIYKYLIVCVRVRSVAISADDVIKQVLLTLYINFSAPVIYLLLFLGSVNFLGDVKYSSNYPMIVSSGVYKLASYLVLL